MSFGEKLKALRQQNDMTQEYVADHLKVSRSTIAGYETKNRQPSHEKLTALAALFQVSVDYLLDEDDGKTVELSVSRPPLSERTLLSRYRSLSVRSKRDLTDYLSFLELRDQDHSGS
nr:helix-turn-helix transcriptional regulator [uncultured Merdimonas sp.]